MILPNIKKARIAPEKIRDYLLSDSHPIGRYKAAVFHSLGYAASAWQTMQRDIEQVLQQDAKEIEITEYGKKYEIRGSIHGPNGQTAERPI